MQYSVLTGKDIRPQELASLFEAVGWGADYSDEIIEKSISAYPFIAHARSNEGLLIGYISSFSDRAFSTMLGELVVHPMFRRLGIARSLLERVEREFSGVPIYVKPLGPAKYFFAACGYKAPTSEICVMFKNI